MKKAIAVVLFAGCFISSYATDARVIAMGRSDDFFMDEESIFNNPANVNIYPNMVYGSYGVYRTWQADSTKKNREYTDPTDPFFGAIVSYPLTPNLAKGAQNSLFSFGAFCNRRDPFLGYLNPASAGYIGSASDQNGGAGRENQFARGIHISRTGE